MQNDTEITPKRIKKFSKVQLLEVHSWMMEGMEDKQIVQKFIRKYHPDNNVLSTTKDKHNFLQRLRHHRDVLHNDDNFKLVSKSSHQGLGKKNIRINALKKRASVTLHELDKLDQMQFNKQINKPDYISLTSALNKELRAFCKQIAVELNEYQTGAAFSVNIDNRRIDFSGQVVTSALTRGQMEAIQAKQQKALDEPQQEED